ncbi:MAG TPA: hypothetical protein VKP30_31365, partial [Polyangiaceae bacterium]|nr:hypothetical protein [Polyangiaceae bacterium]
LSAAITGLSLFATTVGVFWQGSGQPIHFRTLHGQAVLLQGRGLYRYDTVSFAAQGIAQDVVTLAIAIPLLIISMGLARRGGVRGKLLLTGTLGYFLYTYASYAFGAAYNPLFLVYVALFSLSLFGFVLAIMSVDLTTLPSHFSERLPRRGISVFLYALGAFLLLAWLGRIVPSLLANVPPEGIESYTTLIIQALDLGLVIPVALLAGLLLWRKQPWGYLLASVVLVKGLTLSLAVSAMVVNMVRTGVTVSVVEAVVFPTIALIDLGLTVALLRSIVEPSAAPG